MKKRITCLFWLIISSLTSTISSQPIQYITQTSLGSDRIDSIIHNIGSETYIMSRSSKFIYNYNDKNQMSSLIDYTWNSTKSQYDISNIYYYIYNSAGLKLSDSIAIYNSGTFQQFNAIRYLYDTNKNVITKTSYSKNTSNGQPFAAYETRYNYINNKLKQEDKYSLNINTGVWENYGKTVHYFDSYNNDTLIKTYSKNQTVFYLSNYTSNIITYDSNNKKTNRIKQICLVSPADSTQVTSAEKYIYTYDNNENISTALYYLKYTSSSDYILNGRLNYTYDLSKSYIELPEFASYRLDEKKCKVQKCLFYQYSNANFYPQAVMSFNYSSETTTENTKVENSGIMIYNDHIYISTSQIGYYKTTIYNLAGSKILEKTAQNNEIINLNALPKGIYLYKIIGAGKSYQGKLMIQ